MPDTEVHAQGVENERPLCYHCWESYDSQDAGMHTVLVDCEAVCPRCKQMPACYTCRNMYCACDVHQH